MKTKQSILAFLLASCLSLAGAALELDLPEASAEAEKTPLENAALSAAAAPGINILTGTADVVTFDGADASAQLDKFYVNVNNGDYYQEKSLATPAGGTSKAACFMHESWLRYAKLPHSASFSNGRTYAIVFDEYVEKSNGITSTLGVMVNGSGANIGTVHQNKTELGTAYQHIVLKDFAPGEVSFNYQQRFCSDSETNGVQVRVYIDNFAIYPYYTVTYMNFDDTVAGTESVLLDANGNLLTEYTPKTSMVDGAAAFSLTKDGTPVASVPLNHENITLYPVAAKSGPGINTLNGTVLPVTFDGADAASQLDKFYVNVNNGNFYQEKYLATPAGGTSKAACFMHESWLRYAQLPHSASFSDGKTYAIVFDEYVEKSNGITSTLGVMVNGSGANIGTVHQNKTELGTGYQHIVLKDFAPGAVSFNYQQRFCSDSETNGVQVRVYIDNFAIYPYYKITYMNFDDTVAGTDSVLFDANGNLLTEYTPKTSMVSGAAAFSLTKGGTPVASVPLNHENITLYPVAAKSGPGINTLNGTVLPVTFDGADAAAQLDKFYVNVNNGDYYQEKSLATPAGGTSKAACFMHESWLRYAKLPHSASFSNGRTYAIVFDEYVEKSNGITSTLGVMVNGSGANIGTVHQNKTDLGTDYQHIMIKDFSPGEVSFNYQQRFCSDSETNGVQVRVYIDNFAIYPYYKITYMNADDTVFATEQVLFGEGNAFLSAYTIDETKIPEAQNMKFNGWTTEKNGTEAMTSVALDNADVTLYPIFVEKSAETIDKASLRVTGKPGIRFAGYVDEETRNASTEYGFIVAFDNATLEEHPEYLIHNDAKDKTGTVSGFKYTSGVCFNVNDGTDIVYATSGEVFDDPREGYFFTGVLINIPASHYKANVVARPYIVIDGKYLYGESIKRNLYDMADAVRDGGYAGLDQAGIDYIDGILANE